MLRYWKKLVLSQVSFYVNSHNLYNTCQSAYGPGNSTETAFLKVVNDLFLSLNKGNISVLALLDFSSAFDTIDHSILVHRLHTDFGFTDAVLQWLSSCLLIVHTTSLYLIIVLLLLMYTQVFLRFQFLDLCFSPYIISLCLPLSTLSNPCFIAKILEKLVLSQVSSYVNSHNLTILVNQHMIQVTALKQLF